MSATAFRRAAANLALLCSSLLFIGLLLESGVRLIISFDNNYLDELLTYRPVEGDRELNLGDIMFVAARPER